MKKILLFTAEASNFVPVRLQEEAEKLGHEATILDVTNCIISEGFDGELSSAVYVCGKDDPKKNVIGVINRVEIDEDTVIIPRLNEHHLEMKLSMLQRMTDMGAKLINSVKSMELCNDKLMSQVTLNTAGINTPYSFTMQNPDNIEKVVAFMEQEERLKFPVIVKTLRGTHGIGVMKLDSRSSLVSVTQMLLKEEIEFMVQEFIEHDQSARIIMLGDNVLAANLRGQAKDKDEFRTNSHLGSETEPYTPPEDEVEIAKKIVNLFGCNFCAIDYIIVNRDGQKSVIVLEVNGSPGLEAISKNWPDRNLPADVIKFAISITEPNQETAIEPPLVDPLEITNEPDTVEVDIPVDVPAEIEPPDEVNSQDIIHDVELITIHRLCDNVDARIDTGAMISSIHVDSVDFEKGGSTVKFTRGDVTYTTSLVRTILIKNVHGGDSTRRAVISLDVTIHGKRINDVEFTLTDRSNMKYEVLIGRNVLEKLEMPVKVESPKDPEDVEDVEVEVEEE